MPRSSLSYTGSIIDNYTANYIHIATDYRRTEGQNPWSTLQLTRFFRSRDAAAIGSFAAGGFCDYDIKLVTTLRDLSDGTGFHSAWYGTRIFDPNALTWTSPSGTIAPFDAMGNPVVVTGDEESGWDISAPVQFVLVTNGDGSQFKFELLNTGDYWTLMYGNYEGRLVRMQDRNGYGTTIQYKQWTTAELAASPERKWQIDQVIGDSGETMTFSYHAQQYGGRWCVSQIVLPNGQNVTYNYTANRLTSVSHPDGSTSTFTFGGVYGDFYGEGGYSLDPESGYELLAERIDIVDPKAEPTHRRKSVTLTLSGIFGVNADDNKTFLFNQASQLALAVMNQSGEVTYNYRGGYVYEGKGKLKLAALSNYNTPATIWHIKDGWKITTSGALVDSAGNGLNLDDRDLPEIATFSTSSDSQGVTKTYSYAGTPQGYPTTVTYSDSTTETFTYNTFRQVTRHKDRLGNVTKSTYDAKGNLLTQQVGLIDNGMGGETATAEAATTTYEYYPSVHAHQFLLKSVTDPLGNVTDYEYNTNHRLSKVISPPDTVGGPRAETDYTYDTAGRLASILSPGGWSTSFTYDNAGRRTKITHADGSTERFIYGTGNDAGLLVKVKDRAGTVTKYEYDLAGRRIKTIQSYATMDLADNETLITDPALKVEEVCSYIPGTELKASCVRAGEKTTYVYDYRHRLVETKTQPRVGTLLSSKSVYKDNKLFSTEDPYGRKTFYAYRASDAALVRTIQATVPSVSYADFAAVLAATRVAATTPNPTSLITDYTLDNAGRTVATIDPLGITHTVAYDSRGRTTEQIAASGTAVAAKTKTIYDLASRRVEVQHPRYFDSTDTNGFNKSRTTMTYTGRGLLASRTESPGTAEVATESYTYNIEGRQLTRVDARGFTWNTVWNTCCGRQQGSYDPYGHGTIVNVDNLGRATHTATVSNVTAHSANYKDPIDAQTLGETTTKYDTRGRVTARTVWLTPLGQIDPNNVPIYTGPPVNDSANPPAAPYGLTTTYAYDDDLDDNNGLDATFAAHLAGLSLGADSDGSAVLTTNPAGERTLAIRDGLGRGVRSVQLDGSNAALTSNTSTFDTVVTISGYGDVLETASSNALGHTNKSRTDGAGRTIQSLDATSAVTAITYDAGGRRLSVRDPNNVGQDCTYDALGRDISCTDTAGAVTSRTFNLAGHAKTQVDAKGKTTSMVYDSRGRRISMTDRINATTTWAFDAAGNELSMTDAEDQTTVYGYDNAGRRVTIQWPDHVAGQTPGGANYGIEATAYDEAGRKLRSTNQLGDTISHVYDMGSRMLKKEYRTLANSPSGTIANQDTFTYDARSRMLTGVKGLYSNTVAMAYDAGGRKSSESLTIAGQTYTVGTAYDTAGRVQTLTYPDGTTVGRTYDARNLLSTISYGGGNIDTRTYDAGGRLTSETLGNGQVVTRTYMTGDNLLTSINNSAVGNYGYAWDANKNKTGETITGAMSGYGFSVPTTGYDDQNRLTTWNRTDGARNQSWSLSAVSDWNTFTDAGTAVNRTHGPTHEVLTIGSATVTHDSRGNMTQDEQAKQFAWDADGMLAAATVPSGAATGVVGTHSYQYDALGRRVRKATGGNGASDTVFIRDNQTVIAEYTASAASPSPLRKYVNASYVDEPVLLVDRTATGSTGGGTDERFYYHRNQQYSITALCDNAGGVVERYAYTAYGDPNILDGAGSTTRTTSFIGNTYLFTSQEHDTESGLYHFNARMYEGWKGRFIGRDAFFTILSSSANMPVGLESGPYTAAFVPGNCDPSGLEPIPPGGADADDQNWWDKIKDKLDKMKVEDAKRKCQAWIDADKEKGEDWLKDLPDCPCTEDEAKASGKWKSDGAPPSWYHPGCDVCYRSPSDNTNLVGQGAGQQCCYRKGQLVNAGAGAGTPDRTYPRPGGYAKHWRDDVWSFEVCKKAGMLGDYLKRRPPNPGKDKDGNPCPGVAVLP